MIRWSFWVDGWEHPFSSWNRTTSRKAFVEPLSSAITLPPKEHVDFGPWKGPQPGPVKPGIPKKVIDWEAQRLAAEGTAEYWWLDPRFADKYANRGTNEGERVREYPDHYPDPASYREPEAQRPWHHLPHDIDQWSRE